MDWTAETKYIEGTYSNFEYREKVAGFDLDSTLINTKSGSKFAINEGDWKMPDNVVKVLQKYYSDEFCIVIITNQKGIKTGKQNKEQWKNKIGQIANKLKVPFKIFASIDSDIYRKPFMTFWVNIQNAIQIY